ncbi:MAG: long-chain fatty acid--CoA ligase [Desulfobacteraceae bacterium]|nr:MAG: long-chain fatty acid--CoA ligase [Desulfobacteraceae bacterium]
MSIATLLEESSARKAEQVCLVHEGTQVTYGELNARADAMAHGFARKGLRPGDVCVLMMPNSIQWVITYYALAKLGAVVTPVNFLFRTGELNHIFRDSGAKAFIGHNDHLEQPLKAMEGLPLIRLRIASGVSPGQGIFPLEEIPMDEGSFPSHPVKMEETFAIVYTSGTTGLPKGAMLTHGNLVSNAKIVAGMRPVTPSAAILCVLPLFHIYGQTSALNAGIHLGLKIRLWTHFDPPSLLTAIEEEQSSILIAVPTMLNRLLEQSKTQPIRRSGLAFCISGAASLPVEILRRFQETFHTTIYEGYGLTECSPVCVENPFGRPTRPGSIGVAIPQFKARVVDEQDRDVAAGEVGELIVQGPGVMKGYLNQPEASAVTLRGGWLHTGDLARMDQDGYIYIVDRKKDMIIRGGYNVYPRELEEILYSHPDILEAAVIGIPHPDLGEEVAAAIVLREGSRATPEDIRKYMKERVAPYKYPRRVEILNELPKSTTGKIMKRAIRLT